MNVASVDIGSNTILLLISNVDLNKKRTTPILNEHRMPRISKGLKSGQPISSEKIFLLEKVLIDYKEIMYKHDVKHIIATATNAFRIASNSQQIIQEIKAKLGIDIKIISGEEEAYLSFLGATSGITDKNKFLVIDIGGGSTEIIVGSAQNIEYRKSFQIGAVSGTENFFNSDPPSPEQVKKLSEYLKNLFREINSLKLSDAFPIAIAGTPTTLSCIKFGLTEYNEKIIQLSELTLNDLIKISSELSIMTSVEIKDKWPNFMKGRQDIILAGSIILLNIITLLRLDKVYTSTKGIRYGLVEKFLLDRTSGRIPNIPDN